MTAYSLELSEFVRVLAGMDKQVEAAIIKGLQSSGRQLEGFTVAEIQNAKPYPAVDRGDLVGSTEYFKESDGSIVAVTAPHAGPIEFGTRPFRPPLQPLIDWIIRKGIGGFKTRQVRAFGQMKRHSASGRADLAERAAERFTTAEQGAMQLARAIQAKFAREGIAPRHYMAKAFSRILPVVTQEVERELEDL